MRTLLLGLCVPAFALAMGLGAAKAETKLTYASQVPSTHILHTRGMQPMYQEVTKATNGSLIFEEFPGGTMGDAKSLMAIVRDGIVDSALVVYVYYKRDLPISYLITDLGLLGGNNMAMAGASAETHLLDCPPCQEEHKKNNFKALAYYASAPYTLMCTKSVSSIHDLAGLKVRAIGPWAIWLKTAGAVPVSVPSSEVYEALQRGQADCTIGSAAWLKEYNLQDVITHVLDLQVGVYHGALVYPINLDRWGGLTVEERTALLKAMPGLTRRMVMAYREEDEAALSAALARGVKLDKPSDDMLASYDKQRHSEIERVSAAAKADNVQNVDASLQAFFNNVEKWNKIVADINGDPDKFEQALWTEIYSKIDVGK